MATAYVANEGGIALVITLFVVALVTVLVLEYHFDAAVELDLAANYADDVQAYHLALSGVSFARALLLRDDDSADGVEDLWYSMSLIPACFPPQQLLSMAGEEGGVGAIFLDRAEDGALRDTGGDSQACVSLRIIDEQGKLPINALMPEGDNADPDPSWHAVLLIKTKTHAASVGQSRRIMPHWSIRMSRRTRPCAAWVIYARFGALITKHWPSCSPASLQKRWLTSIWARCAISRYPLPNKAPK
jgi:hypothetical protein